MGLMKMLQIVIRVVTKPLAERLGEQGRESILLLGESIGRRKNCLLRNSLAVIRYATIYTASSLHRLLYTLQSFGLQRKLHLSPSPFALQPWTRELSDAQSYISFPLFYSMLGSTKTFSGLQSPTLLVVAL